MKLINPISTLTQERETASSRFSFFWGSVLLIAIVFAGCKKTTDDDTTSDADDVYDVVYEDVDTPLHAASKTTWTFGSSTLTWSDVIQCPECNRPDFEDNYTEPQCCSHAEEGAETRYYYNWAYVNANAATLCPSPWRVPTSSDFSALTSNTSYSTLINIWGYGGYAFSTAMMSVGTSADYWSATTYDSDNAYHLKYDEDYLYVISGLKRRGFQVRCVK
jgi:hypothetical protein